MPFRVVKGQPEIAHAFDVMSNHWKEGSKPLQKNISWQGKSEDPNLRDQNAFTIWWRPQERIWAYFASSFMGKHHLFFAGLSVDGQTVNIDSQFVSNVAINSPPRVGGVFLKDKESNTYLGHTGIVGGGIPGFGPRNFLHYCRQNSLREGYVVGGTGIGQIEWPNGRLTDGFCIADITSDQLLPRGTSGVGPRQLFDLIRKEQ